MHDACQYLAHGMVGMAGRRREREEPRSGSTQSDASPSSEKPDLIDAMKRDARGSYPAGEIRAARGGVMSRKTIRCLRQEEGDGAGPGGLPGDAAQAGENEESPCGPKTGIGAKSGSGDKSDASPSSVKSDSTDPSTLVPEEVIRMMKRGTRGRYSAGEIRMARRGVMSQKSIRRLSQDEGDRAGPGGPPGDAAQTGEVDGSPHGAKTGSSAKAGGSTKSDGINDSAREPEEITQRMRRGAAVSMGKQGLVSQEGGSVDSSGPPAQSTKSDATDDSDGVNANDEPRAGPGKARAKSLPSPEKLSMYKRGLMNINSLYSREEGQVSREDAEESDDDDGPDLGVVAEHKKRMEQARMGLPSGNSVALFLGRKAEPPPSDKTPEAGGWPASQEREMNRKAGFPTTGNNGEKSLDCGEMRAIMRASKQLNQAAGDARGLSLGTIGSSTAATDRGSSLDSSKVFSHKQLEQALADQLNEASLAKLAKLGITKEDLFNAIQQSQSPKEQNSSSFNQASSAGHSTNGSSSRLHEEVGNGQEQRPEGEVRMAQRGCGSRKSIATFKRQGIMRSVKRMSSAVSFSEDTKKAKERKGMAAAATHATSALEKATEAMVAVSALAGTDEYYHIRANITSTTVAQEVLEGRKSNEAEDRKNVSKPQLRVLLFLLILTWLYLVLSITTDIAGSCPLSFHSILSPFALVTSGICRLAQLPFTFPPAMWRAVSFYVWKAVSLSIQPSHDAKRTAFVGRRNIASFDDLITELAVSRVNHRMVVHRAELFSSISDSAATADSAKLKNFQSTSKGLLNLAALIDDDLDLDLTMADPKQNRSVESDREGGGHDASRDYNATEEGPSGKEHIQRGAAVLQAAESALEPLQEYATGVSFDPKLAEGLYLVGVGVRKKSIIKVYAVAMYSSAAVLCASSQPILWARARTFDSMTPKTSFVLEMVYNVGAEKIAGAIADSVERRYGGVPSDVDALESLIVQGVNEIGGQARKGTLFRFDCSQQGVDVHVNGHYQGATGFGGLGSAFVDMCMDDDAVSPTLVESCIETWSKSESNALSSSLLKASNMLRSAQEETSDIVQENDQTDATKQSAIESRMKPLRDYATGITFEPTLGAGLYLIGVGVRKKSFISVYAVSMYSSVLAIEALATFSPGKTSKKDASAALRSAVRSFGPKTPSTTFVLEMVYSASAEKIASAIAESVKPRHDGPATEINKLEMLIVEGVNRKGGNASKGTVFRFDCSEGGVGVTVDEAFQGAANFGGMGSAFVDVFMDDNAVSPTLIDSCLDTWTATDLD